MSAVDLIIGTALDLEAKAVELESIFLIIFPNYGSWSKSFSALFECSWSSNGSSMFFPKEGFIILLPPGCFSM